jgi:hypothetical protein
MPDLDNKTRAAERVATAAELLAGDFWLARVEGQDVVYQLPDDRIVARHLKAVVEALLGWRELRTRETVR